MLALILTNCTFCRKKFNAWTAENRYKFPGVGEFCFDCMACSVCDSKPKGELRQVVGWQPFCKVHYDMYGGLLEKPPNQWPVEFVDARIKFLNRVIERNTKVLAEIMKGPGKIAKIAEVTAVIGGNYDAATYLKVSNMNANMHGMSVQQQLSGQNQDCHKQIKDLEAIKRGEVPVAVPQNATSSTPDPIQILKVRFAKGEITKEQYDEMMKVLQP